VGARGLKGLGQGHGRQNGGEPPGQGREQEEIMVRTPAYHFASPVPLGMPMDPLLNLLVKLSHQYRAMS
jgi:hypothetical protein